LNHCTPTPSRTHTFKDNTHEDKSEEMRIKNWLTFLKNSPNAYAEKDHQLQDLEPRARRLGYSFFDFDTNHYEAGVSGKDAFAEWAVA